MISVSEQQDRHNERRRACNREDATNAKDTKKFTIGVDGSVTDARVLRSIPLLDSAALECARQWRFEPVLLNGRPVPIVMTATVSFP